MVSSVVSSVVYVIFPVLLAIGLVRKYREYKWGKCKDFRSLHGKVFIVTGANSGIGKETAKGLALRQARVILACRDLVNANNVITEIRKTVSTGELIPMKLDLANLSSVHAFADDIIKDFPEIHTLINNAGVSIPLKKNKKTENGFEINFGVNHLGHFVLTNRLLTKLKESAPSRVIIVSSTLHEKGVIDFDNLYGEKGWDFKQRMNPAYANSKLANVYFGIELAKRLEGTGVDVFTVCPGFCYTKLFRHADLKWWKYVLFFPIAFFYLRSANQGSQTILHCAVADLPGMSGKFFRDCKPYMSKHEFQPEISTKLWDVSEKLTSRV